MVIPEDQCGTETDGFVTAAPQYHTFVSGDENEFIPYGFIWSVKGTKGASSSHSADELGVPGLEVQQPCEQGLPSKRHVVEQVLLLDDVDDLSQQQVLGWVSQPGVEDPVRSTWPELLLVEEAPRHHLLAEGHYISWVVQAPVLVGPELARTASSSLNFIYQEGTAMLPGNVS